MKSCFGVRTKVATPEFSVDREHSHSLSNVAFCSCCRRDSLTLMTSATKYDLGARYARGPHGRARSVRACRFLAIALHGDAVIVDFDRVQG